MEGAVQNTLAVTLVCTMPNATTRSLILFVSHAREALCGTTNHFDASTQDHIKKKSIKIPGVTESQYINKHNCLKMTKSVSYKTRKRGTLSSYSSMSAQCCRYLKANR